MKWVRERRIKHNCHKWFDGEISEALKNREKLFRKLKKSTLHIDKELCKVARYLQKLFYFNNKKSLFWKQIKWIHCNNNEFL